MDFRLTEEQEMVRQTSRDFAEKELRPGVAERDGHEASIKLGHSV